jgi:hypothetical protein
MEAYKVYQGLVSPQTGRQFHCSSGRVCSLQVCPVSPALVFFFSFSQPSGSAWIPDRPQGVSINMVLEVIKSIIITYSMFCIGFKSSGWSDLQWLGGMGCRRPSSMDSVGQEQCPLPIGGQGSGNEGWATGQWWLRPWPIIAHCPNGQNHSPRPDGNQAIIWLLIQ